MAVYYAVSDTAPRLPSFGGPSFPISAARGSAGLYVIAFKDPKRKGQPASRRRVGYVKGPFSDGFTAAKQREAVASQGVWYSPQVKFLTADQAAQFFATG